MQWYAFCKFLVCCDAERAQVVDEECGEGASATAEDDGDWDDEYDEDDEDF
jgi:hypothetical protein